jgi:hypothetical protein
MRSSQAKRERIVPSGHISATLRSLWLALCALVIVGGFQPLSTASLPRAGFRGSQPFATLLCKFADVSVEPDPPAYFAQLLGNVYPGLDHYWRAVSYGAIDLAGSMVTGWHALPHPQAHYLTGVPNLPLPTIESPVDLRRLAEDCVAAAGAAIDWSRYTGLNVVFNADLDRPRGTELCLTLDGESCCLRTTWQWPAWYRHQSIWAHEMGHAFGLQHSGVGGDNAYGSLWDVMSVDGPCRGEPGYGRIGQHPIAYQKDVLGWLSADRSFMAGPDSQATITLEQMAAPGPGNYLLARISIPTGQQERESGGVGAGRRYYTVEARQRVGYDASLPGDGVIIHEVDLECNPQARPVSAMPSRAGHPGETIGAAARWLPGQVFRDIEHGIAIAVERATATGFVVTIRTGASAAVVADPHDAAAYATDGADASSAGPWGDDGARPNILAGPRGVYAIWRSLQAEDGGFMASGATRADIYFAHQPVGSAWAPAERINDEREGMRSTPALAVDGAGNVVAAWIDYRGATAAIYAARRPADGTWGGNTRLSSGAANNYANPAIIVNGSGAIHVIWEGIDHCGGDAAAWGEGE